MNAFTKILHLRVDNNGTAPAVTPIYQCSAFTADSPYFYSRKDNPNVAEFEKVIGVLEGAKHAMAVTCGMTAIYMSIEMMRSGETLVLNQHVYGCTFKLFQLLSKRRNFKLKILDLTVESNLKEIPTDTRMVFFETPTNPFLKTINIRRVSDYVKSLNPDALVVVDNTWATPMFQHPLEHGADISLHSGTKYFSGHSDVMNGVLLTNNNELYEDLQRTRFYGGMVLSPESAWLVRRSMQTFELRLRYHQSVTIEMSEFLRTLPQVNNVYYPTVDGSQLTGYGGIIFFEFRDDLISKYEEFSQALKLFGTGTGMACVTSMVAKPYTGSHASMTAKEKEAIGLGENLVRLCFGLEASEDLKEDLILAFKTIDV